jgi:endonuclease YncB( thermonuclease family)
MFASAGSLSELPRRTLFVGAAAFALGVAIGTAISHPVSVAEKSAPASVTLGVETKASVPTASIFGRGIYPAEVLRVADGDTFEARVQVWPGIAITTLVRLRGIDTPELRARCPEERAKAEAARAKLTSILAEGAVELRAVGLDKFGGRVDAAASTRATPDVSTAILHAGLGRSYSGGRRESWCAAG